MEDHSGFEELIKSGVAGLERGQGRSEAAARARGDLGRASEEGGLYSKDTGKGLRSRDTIMFVFLKRSLAEEQSLYERRQKGTPGVLVRRLLIIQERDGSVCGRRSRKKQTNW